MIPQGFAPPGERHDRRTIGTQRLDVACSAAFRRSPPRCRSHHSQPPEGGTTSGPLRLAPAVRAAKTAQATSRPAMPSTVSEPGQPFRPHLAPYNRPADLPTDRTSPRRCNWPHWWIVITVFAAVRCPGVVFDVCGSIGSMAVAWGTVQWTDRLFGNHDLVQVQVMILLGRPRSAQIDIDPHGFDFQPLHRAASQVGLFKGQSAVHPAAQDAVGLARRIQLDILWLSILPLAVEHPQRTRAVQSLDATRAGSGLSIYIDGSIFANGMCPMQSAPIFAGV